MIHFALALLAIAAIGVALAVVWLLAIFSVQAEDEDYR